MLASSLATRNTITNVKIVIMRYAFRCVVATLLGMRSPPSRPLFTPLKYYCFTPSSWSDVGGPSPFAPSFFVPQLRCQGLVVARNKFTFFPLGTMGMTAVP